MKRDWKRILPAANQTAVGEVGVTRHKEGFGLTKALAETVPHQTLPRVDVLVADGVIGFLFGDTGAFANPTKRGFRCKAFDSLPRWEGCLPVHADDPDVTFYVVLPGHEKAAGISPGEKNDNNSRPASPPVLEPEPPGFEEASPPVLAEAEEKPKRGRPPRPYLGQDLRTFDPVPYLPGGFRCIAARPAQLANIALAAANHAKSDSPLGGASVVDAVADRFHCNKAALARFLTAFSPFIDCCEKLEHEDERRAMAECWTEAFEEAAKR